MSSIIKNYLDLYSADKKGQTRVWCLQCIQRESRYYIVVSHGIMDGQMVTNEREVKEGKNIGKKNETSPQEQMIKEADKLWKDKQEKEGYVTSLEEVDSIPTTFAPMLADKWDINSKTKRKVDIAFPCFVQPKLDGIRCLTYYSNGKIVNQSRKNKMFYNMDHINAEVAKILGGKPLVLDGEMYNHDISFNKIAGLVKRQKIKESERDNLKLIQYHIYDCFIPGKESMTFSERTQMLKSFFDSSSYKYLKFVETSMVEKANDAVKLHDHYTGLRYEGIMLRNVNGPYEHSRSKHLQKYKTFEDDEFEVIGYHEGEGTDAGTVVWRCKTNGKKDAKEFDVRPTGTVEERKELFENAEQYIGKMLTVKFQGLSEYGVPRFPVGKVFRDYE